MASFYKQFEATQIFCILKKMVAHGGMQTFSILLHAGIQLKMPSPIGMTSHAHGHMIGISLNFQDSSGTVLAYDLYEYVLNYIRK